MEEKLSEVLDNILGLLLLEGSYDIEEEEFIKVSVETPDAGRLIGARGESLDALQLLVNQIMTKEMGKEGTFKRIVFDVGGWREQKMAELQERSKKWAEEVLETGKEMALEPQAAWQRKIVHEVVGQVEGVETESIGEGRDRHIVIRVKSSELRVRDDEGKENTEHEDAESKTD